MTQVNISEAAKLTGKSRRTIQRYIATGKLSKHNDVTGYPVIDISELIRVFGDVLVTEKSHDDITTKSHRDTPLTQQQIDNELLKKENEFLKQRLSDKDEHIASLKQAMLLLESKSDKSLTTTTPKKRWSFWRR